MERQVGLILGLALGATVVACLSTKHNPLSCAEGTCTDPSLPFCDVDGSVANGSPNTCIAVSCTPGDIAGCRGDSVIRCNDSGNNFDLVLCERGCGVGVGCLSCNDNAQCGNPNPVCDLATHTCGRCTADDQCASLVCDAGTCLVEDSIVYAAPDGGGAACTHSQPCSITSALQRAMTSSNAPKVRLLPGTYLIQLKVPSTASVEVVATGAELAAAQSIVVDPAANLSIRNAKVSGAISCGAEAGLQSQLHILDSQLANNSGSATLDLTLASCDFELLGSEWTIADGGDVAANSSIVIDRAFLHGVSNPDPGALFQITFRTSPATARITNSILRDVTFQIDTSPVIDVAFSTIVLALDNRFVDCNNLPPAARVTYEDNIIVSAHPPASSGGNVIRGSSCTLRHNVLLPQPTPIPGNLVADPLFANQAGGDFHLQSNSPARDAAAPSATLASDHDFDGVMRPQGAQPDIGAFEIRP